jgi:photosynthetic reaction center cytochrome c subunit
MADGTRVKLYFDRQTGLLVRETRYSPTAIGPVATHTVYSDYRLVPSLDVKVPYQWQVTWVDGQYTINLTSFQPNARIDAAKFGKPSPPPSR